MDLADQRPDPDELLASIIQDEEKSKRGKLKIFFGMCAGVGKTYTMLQAAKVEKQKGCDILIGYIETHNRKETAVLVEGFEIIQRKKLEYKYSQRNLSLQLDKVSSDFNYLLNFHKGDTNAVIYDLERQLDTGVVYLSQLKKPQTDDDPSMYDDLFPAIKAYRIKYPSHSNSTNWDNKVAAAMEKIP